ncbi:DUF1697 domain-containing protein [Pseudonocardia kunmingensis]|uniref:Uncharacterized protein (DUF1697 family) n=1 Tax=Pseudonocardia kunmingensis TaxID=630975 RepID=A0A543CYR6_9PSEU|nr:DUF1697 domain-containing protein [Pseudonocardia kunmingensis]TQM02242.1 uncharacterized protein (DUF1697 family) [Pseudonocardia kunmingensis]
MARYVVLLRGINVGRAKRVAMADLRDLLTGMGYGAVRTHLNSGNVVLTGDDSGDADTCVHAARIEAAIRDRLGVDVRCAVLTADELRAIVDGHPFADVADNGSRMMAYVYVSPVDPALVAGHPPVPQDPERARVGDRAVYQWCPDGLMAAPDIGPYVKEHLRTDVTARNWNTITTLAGLV